VVIGDSMPLTFNAIKTFSFVCFLLAQHLSNIQAMHSFLRPIKSFLPGMACVECGKLHSEKLMNKASFKRVHGLKCLIMETTPWPASLMNL